jgi:glycosyltransferase involved in cell wall biosynthesis
MATYNGARYLQEQLDSFVNQERLPDELVVCDDGSTDATPELLEMFSRIAPFSVRIFLNKTNLGYTRNFAQALSNCSGDLIFLSDQDDIWFPKKIDIIERAFQANLGTLLLIHDGELVDESRTTYGVTKLGQVVAGYGSDSGLVTGALTSLRRELLSCALPIPDGVTGHDGWLHYIARMLRKRVVLPESLQYIRRHSSNTSEWIANSSNPINRLAVARAQASTAPATSYQDRRTYNIELSDRLRSKERMRNIDISSNRAAIACDIESEYRAIVNRENLLNLGFIHRKLMAIRMLANRDYRHFNGISSFLRDFLR